MGKPEKKLKKIILTVGIAGAVYGSFRYLLPLVIPFLLAWGLAVVLRPSSQWVARHCAVTVRGRQIGIPVGVAGVAQLVIVFAVLFLIVYLGGRRLCQEASLLMNRLPIWLGNLDIWLTSLCHNIENELCLNRGILVRVARDMIRGFGITLKDALMPFLMMNSVTVFRWVIGGTVIFVVVFVSVGLALQEMETWKRKCEESLFAEEYRRVGRLLKKVGNAYLKTQGIIMLFTTIICMIGFWILKNPYYILAGIGIGLMDALPILGTGTVLIPWAIFEAICRDWKSAIILVILYVICYVIREILEAKMMGDRVGLSPLETLMSMYVGLKLFGIAGFLLGPIGLLLIKDLINIDSANLDMINHNPAGVDSINIDSTDIDSATNIADT